jgi:hypothetical protein
LGEANLGNLLYFKLSQLGMFGGWNFSGDWMPETSAPGEFSSEGKLRF